MWALSLSGRFENFKSAGAHIASLDDLGLRPTIRLVAAAITLGKIKIRLKTVHRYIAKDGRIAHTGVDCEREMK